MQSQQSTQNSLWLGGWKKRHDTASSITYIWYFNESQNGFDLDSFTFTGQRIDDPSENYHIDLLFPRLFLSFFLNRETKLDMEHRRGVTRLTAHVRTLRL